MVYREVSGWVVGLILFGLLFPGINNWAHGGGVISGVLLGMALGYRENRSESPLHRYLAVACGVLTAGCLAWGALGALLFNIIR
jgi:rhomboid protease GluP